MGILAGEQVGDFFSPWCWLSLLGGVVLIAWFLPRHGIGQSVLVFMAFFLLGIALVRHQEEEHGMVLPEGKTLYKAVIFSQPEERGKVVKVDLMVVTGDLTNRLVKATILRDTANTLYRRLNVGDGMMVCSKFEAPRNFKSSRFDYASFLKAHGFVATTFIYKTNWRKARVSLSSLSLFERTRLVALRWRQGLLNIFRSVGMEGDDLAVAVAMTLGDKSLLTKDLQDD